MSRWLATLGDRINPILVKEVRQAVRGRLFRTGYALTLAAALTISLVILMSADGGTRAAVYAASVPTRADERIGPALASSIFGCLMAACFAFVPFSAFMSMGGEWEENTYDLLVLSNLTPRRIVYGKLASALVQSLVCFSAFVPFFVFAFLLRGVNLSALLLLLGGVLVLSPCVSLVALGISSVGGNRFQRIMLMVALMLALVAVTIAGTFSSSAVLSGFIFFRGSWSMVVLRIGLIASIGVAIGAYYGEVACARLSHPEENGSTGVRVAVLVALAGGLAWTAYALSSSGEPEVLSGFATVALFGILWPCAGFACESERLGRRVAMHVPKNRLLALLASPFLPGGGRGMLFWLVVNALLAGGLALLHGIFATDPWTSATFDKWWRSGLGAIGVTSMFCTTWLGIPSRLFARFSASPHVRRVARFSVLLFILLSILLPSLFLFVVGDERGHAFEHPFNPFWLIPKAWLGNSDSAVEIWLFVPLALLLVLLLNLRRIVAGVREVLAASRARRLREHAPAAAAAPAELASDVPPPA
jgi:hypothetical protein